MNVTFYRPNGATASTVKLTDNSYVSRSVMGECIAYVEFLTVDAVGLQSGDRCILLGDTYFVRDQVIPVRDVNRLKYQLTLYGTVNELEKAIYFISDSTGVDNTAKTSWDCTPQEFLDQLIVNLKRIQPGAAWAAGSCLEAEAKTLDFNYNNCLEALQAAAELFETHWSVSEFTVSLNKIDSSTVIPLEVGKDKGLRNIAANKSGDSKVITRLYAYGSSFNNPLGLPLMIPPVDYPWANQIIEGVKEFDDIFPQVVIEITNMVELIGPPPNVYPWELWPDFRFSLNDYLITGVNPRITFLTGELSGHTFNFLYLPLQGDYVILYKTLPDGTVIPGPSGYNPAVGDTFEISGIEMPLDFVEEAQARLLAAAEAYLEASQLKLKLNLTTDDLYFERNSISIPLGVKVSVTSDIILNLVAVDTEVLGYKRYITRPYKYDSLVVGDVAVSSPFSNRVEKIVERTILKQTTVETGVSDKSYVHTQVTPSAEWTVRHNLDKLPSVMVTNGSAIVRDAQVTYLNKNTVRINLSEPGTGFVYCN